MEVRLENIHSDMHTIGSYVSFHGAPSFGRRNRQPDADSLRSVSSVRSVMSSMSSVWSSLTGSNPEAKEAKQKAQYKEDLKYLYSCFTKIPALRLSPDHKARPIAGFEEFPFDTAVPLFVFKNVSSLEICDLDFRTFYGWDRFAEQLRSLTVRNASLEDPIELLQNVVLDDAEKRRNRSSKAQVPTTPSTSGPSWFSGSPRKYFDIVPPGPGPMTPHQRRPSLGPGLALDKGASAESRKAGESGSNSPPRPSTSRQTSLQKPSGRPGTSYIRRSSGSSGSSRHEMTPRHSTSDLLMMGILPSTKWRFLRHLSLAENGLTHLTVTSLAPVAGVLQSLDLSGNLFTEVPEALASLTHLRALNLSNCMIESLSSLLKNPLPAITTLNLRSNRLLSLAGIERLYSLERLDLRDNRLHDPTELARLTGIPDIADLYVIKNPFTKTHSEYRVTIFNLFRSSPGHVQDVCIDTMGPIYHEKKHLVDRVPEPASRPVVKPPVDEESDEVPALQQMIDTPVGISVDQTSGASASRGHRRSTSDLGPRSTTKRKKAPRRRVVELAQTEQRVSSHIAEAPTEAPDLTELPPMPHTPTTESDQPTTPEASQSHQRPLAVRPKLDTGFTSPMKTIPRIRDSSDDEASPLQSPQGLDPTTDLYRQKIEALKDELGPNWLSALGDERLAESRGPNKSLSPTKRASSGVRPEHPSRGVSVGGRTLG